MNINSISRLDFPLPYDLRIFISSHVNFHWITLDRLAFILKRLPIKDQKTLDYGYYVLLVRLIENIVHPSIIRKVFAEWSTVGSIDQINLFKRNFEQLMQEYKLEEQKLQHQVKVYRSNLIRESIRLGLLDLASFYEASGQLELALENYELAAQHYSDDSSKKIIDISLSCMRMKLHQKDFEQAYIQSQYILTSKPTQSIRNLALVVSGICLLNLGRYQESFQTLRAIDLDQSLEYASEQEVTFYLALTAFATLSYDELKTYCERSTIIYNMVTYIDVRECYEHILRLDFNNASLNLDCLEQYALYDTYTATIFSKLKKIILINWINYAISPYKKVRISMLKNRFANITDLDKAIEEFIQKRNIESHHVTDGWLINNLFSPG